MCRVVSCWHAAPVGWMIGHRCRCFDFTSALRRFLARADEVRRILAGMRLWTKCDSMWRGKRREVVDSIVLDDDGVTTEWRRPVDVGNLSLPESCRSPALRPTGLMFNYSMLCGISGRSETGSLATTRQCYSPTFSKLALCLIYSDSSTKQPSTLISRLEVTCYHLLLLTRSGAIPLSARVSHLLDVRHFCFEQFLAPTEHLLLPCNIPSQL